MSMALVILGGAVGGIAVVWLLWLAFQESLWWGLGSLLFAPVLLLFALLHWDRAQTPFLLNLAGLAVATAGAFMDAATRAGG
ncbi:hypothetical protein [Lysobacter enzymogenes]|uniref:Uncharacterized protein n=1 Tax=Lysobacter enzymogenes TaxID=69 RepID=A0AAU9AJQ1_LYSEN|nr:hypothetical protein [Lysobacter enzymogenes]BAV99285.1 conserved hypothetical protein [Lysobacter enzymogenes]